MKQNLKLITGLGQNVDIILQLVDFFNGGEQYSYNKESSTIRKKFTGGVLTELHLICTQDSLDFLDKKLRPRLAREYPDLIVHSINLPCKDLCCAHDDETMRELVYQSIKELAVDNLIISSAGRKTVTNRLVEAGILYGCMGYLTITAPRGSEQRDKTQDFNILWVSARQFSKERQERVIKDELGDNLRSLYLLPISMIKRLRTEEYIGRDQTTQEEELAWLRHLPKADLHCHLGGAFAPHLLKEMATALLDDLQISSDEQTRIKTLLEAQLNQPLADLRPEHLWSLAQANQGKHCLNALKTLFKDTGANHSLCTAVLVNNLSAEQITSISWHNPQHTSRADRLTWYMACGDLGGSALLQSEGPLRLALGWLMQEAKRENVCYQEIRFSPDNYTRAELTISQVIEILLDEARQFVTSNPEFQVNFLIMATRHKEQAAMSAHVAAAVVFGQPCDNTGPRITGFDLAGEEEGNDPVKFKELFLPLHQHFINITIHAGEMVEDDKIWQAIYLLHARRIGHALKLINNPKMMGYVRDHNIAIEMCPTSNIQTNDFRQFNDETTQDQDIYPLAEYMENGMVVTLNTDNRGISQTTLSEEFLRAGQLTQGGLSRWQVLRLIKNSFKAAFLPKNAKDRLLKEIDEQVFSLLLDDLFEVQE